MKTQHNRTSETTKSSQKTKQSKTILKFIGICNKCLQDDTAFRRYCLDVNVNQKQHPFNSDKRK